MVKCVVFKTLQRETTLCKPSVWLPISSRLWCLQNIALLFKLLLWIWKGLPVYQNNGRQGLENVVGEFRNMFGNYYLCSFIWWFELHTSSLKDTNPHETHWLAQVNVMIILRNPQPMDS